MKCVAAHIVLLLLCLSAQAETEVETGSQQSDRLNSCPDVWTELKDLRDMVVGLGNTVVEQRVELRYVEARLKESESKVEQLEKDKAESVSVIRALEEEMAEQKKQVQDLRRIAESKVAFSAGWTKGNAGPFNTETTLKYNAVHVNTGSAYNQNTGVFTAPVGGVYYFTFTAYDHRSSQHTGVHLYHNDKKLMHSYEHNSHGHSMSASNAIVVEMSQGDVVYMRLPSGWGLYSDNDNESTFSGFLLFPL